MIDDDSLLLRAVSRTLATQGFGVSCASDGPEGLDVLKNELIDVALVDVGLPGMDGLEVLRRAKRISPSTEYVIFTGQGDISIAYAALDAGASDYFEKPIQAFRGNSNSNRTSILTQSAELQHVWNPRNKTLP